MMSNLLSKIVINAEKTKHLKINITVFLKPLPVPDKRWVHISIDFIIDFPVSRDLWGKIASI